MIISVIAVFFYPNISCGILLSTGSYILYLWALDHGITKALDDRDKHQVYMVLVMDIILITVLIALGVLLGHIFSLIGILFGLISCKILYMLGVTR